MKKQAIYTEKAPKPGPYAQAVKYGNLVFVAGQTSEDPATGKPIHDSVAQQTERILQHIRYILEAAGSSMEQVLKSNVYISAMEHKPAMNEVYQKVFQNNPPARLTVAVAGIDDGLDVEIDVIAAVD